MASDAGAPALSAVDEGIDEGMLNAAMDGGKHPPELQLSLRATLLLSFVSGGIYAGPWRSRLAADFEAIINEVLEADGQGRHAPLGQYFEMVVWTVLEPPTRLV